MIIDSHQHFWQISRGDYAWMKADSPLHRDYLPQDFVPMLKACHIDGTITVQAAPTMAETHFMLDLAKQYAFIKGVVGWVDMTDSKVEETLKILAQDPHFCGVRPMIQDIADPNWLLQKTLIPAFEALIALDLTFDALVTPVHLPRLIHIVSKWPTLNIVIDHGAKPKIAKKNWQPWADQLSALGEYPNVFCKLSGLLTEAGFPASLEQIKPYMEHLITVFGPKRLMWGSDFPVLNLASDYLSWFNMCADMLKPYGQESADLILGGTAQAFYLS